MALRGPEDYVYVAFKNLNIKIGFRRLLHASPLSRALTGEQIAAIRSATLSVRIACVGLEFKYSF